MLGITIDDVNLYDWKKIIVEDRNTDPPNKKKTMEQIPFSNTPLDFSELYGEQTYEERTLQYSLALIPELRNRESSALMRTQLENFLMSKQQFRLYDDIFPGYYFLAEVRTGSSFEFDSYIGRLTVTFTAYPFRIDSLAEGHDIWDDFNFELDVAQVTEFNLEGLSPNIEISVGDYVTSNAETRRLENTGIKRKVIDKRKAVEGYRFDYLLENNSFWFADYKIMEAYSEGHKISLINPSITSVSPNIESNGPTSIIQGGTVYLFDNSIEKNELFTLKPGINHLEIITHVGIDIRFIFHKELI